VTYVSIVKSELSRHKSGTKVPQQKLGPESGRGSWFLIYSYSTLSECTTHFGSTRTEVRAMLMGNCKSHGNF